MSAPSLYRVFLAVLLLVIVASIVGIVFENAFVLQLIKLTFLSAFILFFLVRQDRVCALLVAFFVFSFLAALFSIVGVDEIYERVFSLLGYSSLIGITMPKFKLLKLDKIIRAYLLVVFLINTYFVYVLYGVLKAVMVDLVDVTLFAIKSMSLIILVFVAFGVYLHTETKQTITFLMAGMCFAFSTILEYINFYYVYNWGFVLLGKILFAFGVYLIAVFMIQQNRKVRLERHRDKVTSSEGVFA
ncbi:hypothetical protein [Snuella sedimenti]|uniref:Uncharacterized protein n=1 Tax=Snuella sedimenti TaxID=2798802 RepID=A0A8J7J5R7_9FLAO|nr:hypothetical protein [Snuella sedimenti]MBJ6369014.1 hypothetical protein [Snuella sedimenti]